MRADNATGFKGVYRNEGVNKSFRKFISTYATAEEAALAYARALGPELEGGGGGA